MKKLKKMIELKPLNKDEQKTINGGLGRRGCCDPTYDCCMPNPNFNGSGCQFVYASYPCCI